MILRSSKIFNAVGSIAAATIAITASDSLPPPNKKQKIAKSPPTQFVVHPFDISSSNQTLDLPLLSPNALVDFEEHAAPLLAAEKVLAQSTFKDYVDEAVKHPLLRDTIPGYPKYDPDNPSHPIHSLQIPSQRHMSSEQLKLVNNKIHEPRYRVFKNEMNNIADLNMTSLDIFNAEGRRIAQKRINLTPEEYLPYWDLFKSWHIATSVGYSGGCPAAMKQDAQSMDYQMKNEKPLSSAGLQSVSKIHSIHANNKKSTNTSTRAHYENKKGETKSFTFSRWLDFNNMSEKDKAQLFEINPLPNFLHQYYIDQAPRFLEQHNISAHPWFSYSSG